MRLASIGAVVLIAMWTPVWAAGAPASSATELASRFQNAVNEHDKKAVDELVYWGTADAWSRDMTESVLTIYEAETITSAKLAPLDNSSADTFDMNGHKYGPSIPAVYRVVVQYAHGPNVKVDEGSFTIGKKDGGWYVIAIARLK